MSNDIQGLRVFFNGNVDDQGTVTRDLGGERVKVVFDDGKEEYVPRDSLEVLEDE
ncbi:hypothetical protein RGQ21_67370 [Kitasatospora aureofaciens]|nr:hypothetical protein RGQ21_67370 [Kitasatospora aureofaciens]